MGLADFSSIQRYIRVETLDVGSRVKLHKARRQRLKHPGEFSTASGGTMNLSSLGRFTELKDKAAG